MPRFAANLSWLFSEWPFLDRFAAAADAGFTAVEAGNLFGHSPETIAEQLRLNGLDLVLFNLLSPDADDGRTGLAALPDRFPAFQSCVERALDLARATGVRCLHLMTGLADPTDPAANAAFERSVRWAAEQFDPLGVTITLEPINARDVPGYYLRDYAIAEQAIANFGLPNLKLQFDVYHRQIIHGDVTVALRRLLPITGHVQVANVPARDEPDGGGEINFPFLFAELDRLGYDGVVAGEYRPRGPTRDGLGWAGLPA